MARVSRAKREKVILLRKRGFGCAEIARLMDLTPDTVSDVVHSEGMAFGGADTLRIATAAQKQRNARRRAHIIEEAYQRAESILASLREAQEGEFRALVRGEKGAEYEEHFDFVPSRDEQALANALSRQIEAATHLEKIDDSSSEQVSSLLSGMAEALGITDGVLPSDGEE